MIVSTVAGALLLLTIETNAPNAFLLVWLALLLWLILRTFFGMLRIWPGHARAPAPHACGGAGLRLSRFRMCKLRLPLYCIAGTTQKRTANAA